jgi:hypothetical protein
MAVASIVSPSTGPYKLPLSVASPDTDFSRFLQLQAQAVSSMPTQSVGPGFSLESRDNSIDDNSSTPLSTLRCCRCRCQFGHSGMFQFGTNLYYCGHCARMVGYIARIQHHPLFTTSLPQ